jgi:hypothetical protein
VCNRHRKTPAFRSGGRCAEQRLAHPGQTRLRMPGAAHLRAQAEFCLQMAQQMSDRRVAEGLRITAAEYLARAREAEGGAASAGAQSGTERAMTRYYFKADYKGVVATDEEGKEFASFEGARAYAAKIASELARNNSGTVTVFVVSEEGAILASELAADQM